VGDKGPRARARLQVVSSPPLECPAPPASFPLPPHPYLPSPYAATPPRAAPPPAAQVKALKDGKAVDKPIYNHVSGLLDPPEKIDPASVSARGGGRGRPRGPRV
jgi:hypothetical protein